MCSEDWRDDLRLWADVCSQLANQFFTSSLRLRFELASLEPYKNARTLENHSLSRKILGRNSSQLLEILQLILLFVFQVRVKAHHPRKNCEILCEFFQPAKSNKMSQTTAISTICETSTAVNRVSHPLALTDRQRDLIEKTWKTVEEDVGLLKGGVILFMK